jgi:hypothetical protein
MTANLGFSVTDDRYVIDHLTSKVGKTYCYEGDPENDTHLRERMLRGCLSELTDKLIVNTAPLERSFDGKLYQPFCAERHSIWEALYSAIEASHLNTLEVGLSLQHKFDGQLRRKKSGTQDYTSLSLFVDDVECLLRELYGDCDQQATDRVRSAAFCIVAEFTKYLRKDLWKEHDDAVEFDYILGIGVPEGSGISSSEWRSGMWAKVALFTRACEVSTNPSAYSEYTVEFAKRFGEHWALPNNYKEFLSLTDEEKMCWLHPSMNSGATEEEVPF